MRHVRPATRSGMIQRSPSRPETSPMLAADTVPAGPPPMIENDAVVLGILFVILGFVFWTSSRESGFWKKFYVIFPALLLCYFIPS